MKKIGIICILLCIGLIIIYKMDKLSNDKPLLENKEEIKSTGIQGLAIMLQNEKGGYDLSNTDTWPASGYVFNDLLSSCEKGGKLSWNEDAKSVTLKTRGSDKCYVYFDFDDENYIRDLSGHNNHGKYENIVSLTNEGVTTSDETKSGYVDCGLANYNFNNTVSIIMKVKWNSLRDIEWSSLLGNLGNASSRYGFNLSINHPSSVLTIEINGNQHEYFIISKEQQIKIGEWYTLIGIYDGNNLTLCINNDCISETKINGLAISNAPIFLAASSIHVIDGDYNTFSDLLIYDRAITEEEKISFATDINPKNTNDLILWYKFSK